MLKQNLHTHSTYCDGKDTVEEMVLKAIEKGFSVLGFSGHCFLKDEKWCMTKENTVQYIQDVLKIKEQYKDEINIFLGLEQDLQSNLPNKRDSYDYLIGSVHQVLVNDEYISVDESQSTTNKIVEYYGTFMEFAKVYYDEVKKLGDIDQIDIIGHIDLLMKFNEDETYISFEDEEYLKLAYDCIDELVKKGKIFEVNTGAISRKVRLTPYPHKRLLQHIYNQGGKICLNSDCHDKNYLDHYYDEAYKLIEECGFTSMMYLTDEGFEEVNLDQFKNYTIK